MEIRQNKNNASSKEANMLAKHEMLGEFKEETTSWGWCLVAGGRYRRHGVESLSWVMTQYVLRGRNSGLRKFIRHVGGMA